MVTLNVTIYGTLCTVYLFLPFNSHVPCFFSCSSYFPPNGFSLLRARGRYLQYSRIYRIAFLYHQAQLEEDEEGGDAGPELKARLANLEAMRAELALVVRTRSINLAVAVGTTTSSSSRDVSTSQGEELAPAAASLSSGRIMEKAKEMVEAHKSDDDDATEAEGDDKEPDEEEAEPEEEEDYFEGEETLMEEESKEDQENQDKSEVIFQTGSRRQTREDAEVR
jgi:hypothetical protein